MTSLEFFLFASGYLGALFVMACYFVRHWLNSL